MIDRDHASAGAAQPGDAAVDLSARVVDLTAGLPGLSVRGLQQMRDSEATGRGRVTLLRAIDRELSSRCSAPHGQALPPPPSLWPPVPPPASPLGLCEPIDAPSITAGKRRWPKVLAVAVAVLVLIGLVSPGEDGARRRTETLGAGAIGSLTSSADADDADDADADADADAAEASTRSSVTTTSTSPAPPSTTTTVTTTTTTIAPTTTTTPPTTTTTPPRAATTTTPPPPSTTTPPPPPSTLATSPSTTSPPDCTPGYSPCIPPGGDVDCAGGSGDGPRYVEGPVYVDHTSDDIYDLDRDGNGVGCQS